MDYAGKLRMKFIAERADAFLPWFLHTQDLLEDLNKKDFRIVDKNGNLVLLLTEATLEKSIYICDLHNVYLKDKKVRDDSQTL